MGRAGSTDQRIVQGILIGNVTLIKYYVHWLFAQCFGRKIRVIERQRLYKPNPFYRRLSDTASRDQPNPPIRNQFSSPVQQIQALQQFATVDLALQEELQRIPRENISHIWFVVHVQMLAKHGSDTDCFGLWTFLKLKVWLFSTWIWGFIKYFPVV